jgi:hypothetical protein
VRDGISIQVLKIQTIWMILEAWKRAKLPAKMRKESRSKQYVGPIHTKTSKLAWNLVEPYLVRLAGMLFSSKQQRVAKATTI